MHRSEATDLTRCVSCGAEIYLGVDRAFVITPDSALCFECAIARGAAYDELHDRWLEGPDITDVPVDVG